MESHLPENYCKKVTFRLTTEQKHQLEEAATKARISPSEWTRRQILKALGPASDEHRILRLIAFQSEVNRLTVVAATSSENVSSNVIRERIEGEAMATSEGLLARWLVAEGSL